MSIKSHLKLIIDNTLIHKVNALLDKQKKLIKGKIHLQNEAKEIKKLLQQYEDNIIKIENKLNTYRRKQDGKRNTKQTRNVRSGRNKTKKDNA
tara:strand:+ start:15 stop:293 length:279 start_codon:yes stop_codon:yes gene_type:complete